MDIKRDSIKRNISRLIPIGAQINCACNSGAKKLYVMGYKGMQNTRRRLASGGVGSIAVVSVKKGKNELKRKKFYALIIRQKAPMMRFSGSIKNRIFYSDNAAIILNDDLSLKKTTIKGVIAKEVTEKVAYANISGVLR